MAEGTRSLDITPGLLSLHHLAINKHKLSPAETKVLKRITGDQQMLLGRELKRRKFACAAQNLRGLISYRTGNKKEAISIWKDTLKEDATNLNALQDLITTHENLEDSPHAKEYKRRYQEATDDSLDEQKRKERQARCLAEQAYARFCDLQTKAWDNSCAREAQIKWFEEALICGKDVISQEERRDWLFYKGQAYEKLANSQFRVGGIKFLDSVVETYACLWKCLQMSKKPMHKAQVWCALGNLFARRERHDEVLKRLFIKFPQQKLKMKSRTNPKICYETALSLDKENEVWILARLGMCYFKNRDKAKALKAFNESINAAENLTADDPMRNACRLAYDYRATLYVHKSKLSRNAQGKRHYLDMAQADTEKALHISLHPNPFATSAEVHYLLATLEDDDSKKVQLLETALEHFQDSVECQDGQSIPVTHIKSAQCHDYMNNQTSATKRYQKALNCLVKYKQYGSPADKLATQVATELLSIMLKNCQLDENPASLRPDVAKKLKLMTCFLDEATMQQVIQKITCKGYLSEYLKVLHQAIEEDPDKDLVQSCIEAIANTDISKREEEDELLSELSFNYQKWKASPQVEEDQYPQTAVNKDFDHDFYVISDDTDVQSERWVKQKLFCKLESYGFKGYNHSRNSKLGELDTALQAEVMKNSCYIFPVITSGFCGNQECLFQTEMACKSCPPCQVVTLQLQTAKVPRNLEHFKCFDFTGQDDFHQLAWYMNMNPEREE